MRIVLKHKEGSETHINTDQIADVRFSVPGKSCNITYAGGATRNLSGPEALEFIDKYTRDTAAQQPEPVTISKPDPAAGNEPDDFDDDLKLDDLKFSQLKDLAEQMGIDVPGHVRSKADMIALIEAHAEGDPVADEAATDDAPDDEGNDTDNNPDQYNDA